MTPKTTRALAKLRKANIKLSERHPDHTEFLLAVVALEHRSLPLTDEQREQVRVLQKAAGPRVLAEQRADCVVCKGEVNEGCGFHGGAHPYAGAIGGATTYIVTPTSMGHIIEVEVWGEKHNITGDL